MPVRHDKDIKQYRKENGIAEPKSGKKICLRCSKKFISEDILKNRICVSCLCSIKLMGD